jgi:hypothetical protein
MAASPQDARLLPIMRLTALAVVFAGAGLMTTGWVRSALMVCAAGAAVVAALKLVREGRSR